MGHNSNVLEHVQTNGIGVTDYSASVVKLEAALKGNLSCFTELHDGSSPGAVALRDAYVRLIEDANQHVSKGSGDVTREVIHTRSGQLRKALEVRIDGLIKTGIAQTMGAHQTTLAELEALACPPKPGWMENGDSKTAYRKSLAKYEEDRERLTSEVQDFDRTLKILTDIKEQIPTDVIANGIADHVVNAMAGNEKGLITRGRLKSANIPAPREVLVDGSIFKGSLHDQTVALKREIRDVESELERCGPGDRKKSLRSELEELTEQRADLIRARMTPEEQEAAPGKWAVFKASSARLAVVENFGKIFQKSDGEKQQGYLAQLMENMEPNARTKFEDTIIKRREEQADAAASVA